VPFPGYETLRAEGDEAGPKVMVRVSDADGTPIRWVEVPARQGVQRVTWDLRHPAPDPISFATSSFRPPWVSEPTGPLAAPGAYSAQLVVISAEGAREVGPAQLFQVKPVPTAPAGTDFQAVADFQYRTSELRRGIGIAGAELGQASERIRYMRAALVKTPGADAGLHGELDALQARINAFRLRLQGDRVRQSLDQSTSPSISGRAGVAAGSWGTRQEPTATQRENLELAERDFGALQGELSRFLTEDVMRVEEALAEAGAPWTPGRGVG
jgi:hypothetical protein